MIAIVRRWWRARRMAKRLRSLRIVVINENGSTVLYGEADVLLQAVLMDGGITRVYLNGPSKIELQAVDRDA